MEEYIDDQETHTCTHANCFNNNCFHYYSRNCIRIKNFVIKKELNRNFIGIEKDENYFKMAEERLKTNESNTKKR